MILEENEVKMKSFKYILEKYIDFKELLERVCGKITDENIETIFEELKDNPKLISLYNKIETISLVIGTLKQTMPMKEEIGMGVTGANAAFSSAGSEPPEYIGELTTCQLQSKQYKDLTLDKLPKTMETYNRLTIKK